MRRASQARSVGLALREGQRRWCPPWPSLREHGMTKAAPGQRGRIIRENMLRGREWMREELEHDRPTFDFMGKLVEWGKEKSMKKGGEGYFYLEYLIDMEGFPPEMRNKMELTPYEETTLRLVSISEERRFWKSFFFYQHQYEFENKGMMLPVNLNSTLNIQYALRQAGIASPKLLAALEQLQVDDHILIGVSHVNEFKGTQFVPELRNTLSGVSIVELFLSNGFERDACYEFLLTVETLKSFPVEVRSHDGTILLSRLVAFEEAPNLKKLAEALSLEGGREDWYFDIRDVYSTPAKMVFDDFAYQNFLIDWWLMGSMRYGGLCSKGKMVIFPRTPSEEETAARRAWLNVI